MNQFSTGRNAIAVLLIPVAAYGLLNGVTILDLDPRTFAIVTFCANSWWWAPLLRRGWYWIDQLIDRLEKC